MHPMHDVAIALWGVPITCLLHPIGVHDLINLLARKLTSSPPDSFPRRTMYQEASLKQRLRVDLHY